MKRPSTYLFFALGCIGAAAPLQAASAAISFASSATNALTTSAGSNLTVTADRAVTWSLAAGSIGSLQQASSNSVVYVPPAGGIAAQNSYGGCMVLPNDSVFNTRIDSLPVNSQSAVWIAESLGYGANGIVFSPSWGFNLIDNSVPMTAASFYYGTLPAGTPFQFAPAPARKRETGALTHDGSNDHHMISINHQTCTFYESYQDTGATTGNSAQSGYLYNSSSYSQPQSGTTDAAGLPLAALTLHVSEIQAGAIRHALRFTACRACIASTHVWPAVYTTGSGINAAPMGSRWRLKSTFNISGFSPYAQTILTALQQYGMLLADIGTTNQIQTSSDVNTDPAVASALYEIGSARIISSDFDIVDESSLQASASSHRAKPNGSVQVANYAVLNATDATGNTLTVPIAVQPILVGTPYTYMVFQAGQSIQLNSWVNGAANQQVNWTTNEGFVSATGLYTPPASVASPTPVQLTATAAADSTSTVVIHGWVIPSGAIRIDVGGTSPYMDSKGNEWLADTIGFETGSFARQNDNYPSNAWGNIADPQLYQTYDYTWGDDIVYGPFVVPNGTYTIHFLFGLGECTGTVNASSVWDNSLVGGPVALEANGVDTTFYIRWAENYTCRTPAIGTITTQVKNNLLTVALRSMGSSSVQSAPDLNALSILHQ